jgi:hypothetical protein
MASQDDPNSAFIDADIPESEEDIGRGHGDDGPHGEQTTNKHVRSKRGTSEDCDVYYGTDVERGRQWIMPAKYSEHILAKETDRKQYEELYPNRASECVICETLRGSLSRVSHARGAVLRILNEEVIARGGPMARRIEVVARDMVNDYRENVVRVSADYCRQHKITLPIWTELDVRRHLEECQIIVSKQIRDELLYYQSAAEEAKRAGAWYMNRGDTVRHVNVIRDRTIENYSKRRIELAKQYAEAVALEKSQAREAISECKESGTNTAPIRNARKRQKRTARKQTEDFSANNI